MFLLALIGVAGAAERVTPVRAEGPIRVDGALDEGDWARAAVVSGFVSALPDVGRADPGTEARVLYDDHALYFGFTVKIGDQKLAAALVPRDQTLLHDWVGVVLDTYEDRQRAFAFRVNPKGVQADGVYQESSGDLWNQDLSWDGVWESAARITPDGYTVEMAIPWRTLRYPRAGPEDWGILLLRNTPVPYTTYAWPALSQDSPGWLVQAADLGPLSPPPDRPRWEIMPTLTFLDSPGAIGRFGVDPFEADANPSLSPGLDARLGITSSLTANVALNPDFSQIEADADQVEANVEYPLYYEEKRPFFLEGADRFSTPLDVVYTRSIVDPLFGARLTGRAGSVGMGLLSTWDQSPAPSTIYADYATGRALPTWDAALTAGGRSLVNVAHVTRDFGEASSLGVLVADKELSTASGDRYGNHVGGFDGRFVAGRYEAYGQALVSDTDTPDVPLSGPAWVLGVIRNGDHLALQAEQTGTSPGFRAESGFLQEVGRYGGSLNAITKFSNVGPFRSLQPALRASTSVDPAGDITEAETGAHLKATLGERAYGSLDGAIRRERYLDTDFDLWSTSGYAGVEPSPSSEIGLGWKLGTEPYYDAPSQAALFRGFVWGLYPYVHALLFRRADLEYDGTGEQFREGIDGPAVETTWIHRLRIGLNLSRPLSIREIEQIDTWTKTLDSSVQVAWEKNYGTAAYLGYNDTRDLSGLAPVERTIYAKLSVLWAP